MTNIALYMSNSDKQALTSVIIIIVAFITILLAAAYYLRKVYEKDKKAEEKQRKENEERRRQQEEQERIENIPCLICRKKSYGYIICENCMDRSKILVEEIPSKYKNTYDKLCSCRYKFREQVITAQNFHERETAALKLIGVAQVLDRKYLVHDAVEEDEDFLEVTESKNRPSDEELKKKYVIKKANTSQKTYRFKNYNQDFRKAHSAKFFCKDGHYVRSKVEREIDNFLFDNNIKHIYEYEYYNVQRDKKFYPDFYLPQYNLIIEYFGRTDPQYINKKYEKIEIYKADNSVNFEYLDEKNDFDIIGALKKICQKYNIQVKE